MSDGIMTAKGGKRDGKNGLFQLRQIKDPGSALTHFVGFVAAVIFAPVLLAHAFEYGASGSEIASLAVFSMSMILLYCPSGDCREITADLSLGNCRGRYRHKCLLDYVSEMAFFCNLYLHGLGLYGGTAEDYVKRQSCGVFMAAGRRHYLHDWRCYLRA